MGPFPCDPLPPAFYEATAESVAPALLGHYLVKQGAESCGGVIVETEAYLADDPASHSYRGETARNRAMFGPQGRAYVYLIYGMHYCVNAVCRPRGVGEAVLIRALEPMIGEETMRSRRPVNGRRQLTNGPAKLCAALGIGRELDAVDLCCTASALVIARNPAVEETLLKLGPLKVTPRVGITKAAARPLRFLLSGSDCVSR